MAQDITEEFVKGQPKEETINAFYNALGQAITWWQRVEMGLFDVFRETIGSDAYSGYAIGAAFHSVQQFKTQLTMTDAAVRVRFVAGSISDQWQTFFERLNTKSAVRNSLVHFHTIVASQRRVEHEKIYLEPSFLDSRYPIIKKKKPRFTVNEISTAGKSFLSLGNELTIFSLSIRQQIEQQKRFFSQ